MNEGDRAIIGLLDIIHAHIDNGDFDKARGVINRTKTTLDGDLATALLRHKMNAIEEGEE